MPKRCRESVQNIVKELLDELFSEMALGQAGVLGRINMHRLKGQAQIAGELGIIEFKGSQAQQNASFLRAESWTPNLKVLSFCFVRFPSHAPKHGSLISVSS